jgi:hypothetical protein
VFSILRLVVAAHTAAGVAPKPLRSTYRNDINPAIEIPTGLSAKKKEILNMRKTEEICEPRQSTRPRGA